MIVVAVITLAVKEPEASLATIVEAPFADAAVVAELGIDVREAPEPLNVVAVITLAVKDPEASLATIVEAPLADAAVVLALSNVPVATLDAFKNVSPEPLPEIDVDVIALAVKEPEAFLATIVEAPFAEAAVVLALSNVPVATFDAFKFVKVLPLPTK